MKKSSYSSLRTFCSGLALAATLGTTACSPVLGLMRDQTANRLASPAWMYERQIPEGKFVITLYERVRRHSAPATIYIEGDGLAWVSRSEPSMDPTPTNPVALHLATRDNAPNVIYIARPCQYAGLVNNHACPDDYWTGKGFAPEILASMNAALDEIKGRYSITGFNLVGYSGGGAVAVLLAAQRSDVLTLRTVAGNLDPALFSQIHDVSPMAPGSLSPIDAATRVAQIPQRHFIGIHDTIVPKSIFESFKRAAGPSGCINSSVIIETDHEAGWVNKWPDLLQEPLSCAAATPTVPAQ